IALVTRSSCRSSRWLSWPAFHIRLAVGSTRGIGIEGSFLVLGTSRPGRTITWSGRVQCGLARAERPPASSAVPHAPTARPDCSAGLDGELRKQYRDMARRSFHGEWRQTDTNEFAMSA